MGPKPKGFTTPAPHTCLHCGSELVPVRGYCGWKDGKRGSWLFGCGECLAVWSKRTVYDKNIHYHSKQLTYAKTLFYDPVENKVCARESSESSQSTKQTGGFAPANAGYIPSPIQYSTIQRCRKVG